MNEQQRNSFQYEVIMSSFKQQIADKQILLQKLTHEANQKIINNTQNIQQKNKPDKQSTTEVVKLCRRNIQQIQGIFADIHTYFVDLKLQFMYRFFVGVFRNMVMLFKLLSQKLVLVLKQKKKKQVENDSLKTSSRNTQKVIEEIKNKNLNEIQYLDSMIRRIQIDQATLEQKQKDAQRKFYFQKKCIQSINASDAVNQLESLKKQMQRIIMCSVRLGDDEQVLKNQYNTKIYQNITNSINMQQQYCKGIAMHTRETFIQKMNEIAKRFKISLRQQFKQQIMKQINDAKPKLTNRQIQTQPDSKYTHIKDKNAIIAENQQIKKLNINYKKQIYQLNKQLFKTQQQQKQQQKQLQITSQLLNKKINQFQKTKMQYENTIRNKDQIIQAINRDLIQLKSQLNQKNQNNMKQQNANSMENNQNSGDNESVIIDQNLINDQMFLSKMKNINMKTNRSSIFYQKQYKATKQQNQYLRRSLNLMLDALKQQQLISDYPINLLNEDIKLGKLASKIQSISVEVAKKIKGFKQVKFKNQSQQTMKISAKGKNKSIIPNPNKEVTKQDRSTQTNQLVKNNTNKTINKQVQKTNKKQNIPQNKLQFLKQQLMKKVNNSKKPNKKLQYTQRSRLYLHEIDQLKNQNNFSMQNLGNINLQKNIVLMNTRRISKKKSIFNKKDISFEQFRFNMQEPKENIDQFKKLTKKGYNNLQNFQQNYQRRLNNRSYDFNYHSNIQEQPKQAESIVKIQRFDSPIQVKKIMQSIAKTQNKDNYVKNIIKKLVQQLNKYKSTKVITQILKQTTNKNQQQNIPQADKQINQLLIGQE